MVVTVPQYSQMIKSSGIDSTRRYFVYSAAKW
jgi:hypothetical protein